MAHSPSDSKHHEQLISGAVEQLKLIFDKSQQGIYLYLDNTHKWCNSNFSKMLGYASPEEWSKLDVNFPEVFVASKSRKALVSAYQDAMDHHVGSCIDIVWKKKDGKDASSNVILIPYAYEGHPMALHFVSKK